MKIFKVIDGIMNVYSSEDGLHFINETNPPAGMPAGGRVRLNEIDGDKFSIGYTAKEKAIETYKKDVNTISVSDGKMWISEVI